MIIILLILVLSIIGFLLSIFGTRIVPHQEVWIVQRFGRFKRSLSPGLNWIIPTIDQVAYRHSLKEEAVDVTEQTAITQDNVSVILDGVVYIKIIDPVSASYGVKDPMYALTQLVQTTMRSEIGKVPLDKTFEERESLNRKMVEAINEASFPWGIQCIRYEIKDIKMPEEIRKAMELQMTAERQKRARILESEGLRQAAINESEGQRQAQMNLAEGVKAKIVLESEAAHVDCVNRAKGESEAIQLIAFATSCSIEQISRALSEEGGEKAASLQVAEKYIAAFRELAKESNTLILPSNLQHPGAAIGEAMAIYGQINAKVGNITKKRAGFEDVATDVVSKL
jgi:regulator of protease activity HflC (stomatin/prohibitin superfamily)